jgi:hypothetical protein
MPEVTTRRRDPLIVATLLLAIVGTMLAWQGWRQRMPTIDLVPHYLDALAFVREGIVPSRGTVGSSGAYNPPGSTWLIVPGVLATNDPRLAEFFASSLAYGLTVIGIYLLARSSFSRGTAILAASIFACSEVGLFVASTVWPRAPVQPFVVWMIYWLRRWAVDREGLGLAIALAIYGSGMYVFMEIAPLVLLIPLSWYLYSPPVYKRALGIAAVVLVAVWSPYLAYEAGHDYRDLRSIVLRTDVRRANAVSRQDQPWCDPRLVVVNDRGERLRSSLEMPSTALPDSTSGRVAETAVNVLLRVRGAVANAVLGLVGRTSVAGTAPSVLVGTALVIALIAVGLSHDGRLQSAVAGRIPLARARAVVGLAVGAFALLVPSIAVPLFSPDGLIEPETDAALQTLQLLLLVTATLVTLAGPILKAVWHFVSALPSNGAARGQFLLMALLVPLAALLVIVEPGRSDRMWWLWPLVTIFLASLILDLVRTATALGRIAGVGLAILIFAFTGATEITSAKAHSWRTNGWEGADGDDMRAAEYIASRVHPGNEARIGYHLPFFEGIPALATIDRRFKVGAEFDLVLAYRFRIANESRCAEGFGPDDEYRLAWESSRSTPHGMYRALAAPGSAFHQVRRFGGTELFER